MESNSNNAEVMLLCRFQEFLRSELGRIFRQKFPYSTYLQCSKDEAYLKRVIEWHTRIHNQISDDSNPIGTILDYGSGFGFTLFCLAAFDPESRFVGIELVQEIVDFSNRLRDEYFGEYDIEFICSARPELPVNIDAALFINVLSHVKLPMECLFEVASRMSYAARIYIEDNNSGLSFVVKRRNRKI